MPWHSYERCARMFFQIHGHAVAKYRFVQAFDDQHLDALSNTDDFTPKRIAAQLFLVQ